jgi:hypothetical protein
MNRELGISKGTWITIERQVFPKEKTIKQANSISIILIATLVIIKVQTKAL